LEEPVARVLREGRAVELANHAALVTKDGRTVPIEDSAAPILDAAGACVGVVLVFHDVTEKRRAEEALRQAEQRRKVAEAVGAERERFNTVLDMLPAYVILLSPDYRVRLRTVLRGASASRRTAHYDICLTARAVRTAKPTRCSRRARRTAGGTGRQSQYDICAFLHRWRWLHSSWKWASTLPRSRGQREA
jgi:PAS domain-containing protein